MKESNPQVPNEDQLEHISPRNDPRKNAARYEDPPEETLSPPVPTVKIGPNAVYLVDPGYWPEKAEDIKPPEPGPEPEPEEEPPVLDSIIPATLPVWAQDTEVTFRGEGFTEESVINWNGGDEVTDFVSETELKTLVKPSTVQAPLPFELQTYVRNGDKQSQPVTFTFIT